MSAPSLCHLLLAALFSSTFGKDEPFRFINRRDLLTTSGATLYTADNNTVLTQEILFDLNREQLIIGARDSLLRLSLRNLRELEKASWPADPHKIKLCQDKGQNEENCHNYIRVLHSMEEKVFACGTGAFSPICSWRALDSLQEVSELLPGEVKCPYDPKANVTTIITEDGHFYSGSTTNFAGTDSAVYRAQLIPRNETSTLRTSQFDQNTLNEPQFVGSFGDEHFVYFVFREDAIENYNNYGKMVFSRIGRVCRNDTGSHIVSIGTFTTFLKARLLCSVPGDYPFLYDWIESISYDNESKLLFATFNTPINPGVSSAAICVYSMDDISKAFESGYNSGNRKVAPSQESLQHFNCRKSETEDSIKFRQFKLVYDPVTPVHAMPVYRRDLERFTSITVDNLGKDFVAYVVTKKTQVLKISISSNMTVSCLIEAWNIEDNVKMIRFLKDTQSVYITTEKQLLNVPEQLCARYVSNSSCITSGDPYCEWSEQRDICVKSFDPQFRSQCRLELPVEGGWSEWSEWSECIQEQDNGDQDQCQCKTRTCDNPTPSNGGTQCQGSHISVSQCTVHGGWSAWEAWGPCSETCGLGVKLRKRTCTAPAPKNGGRLCVGQDTIQMHCHNLPPCVESIEVGKWGEWSQWGPCIGQCGTIGTIERSRTCLSPPCEGSDMESRGCNPPCPRKKAVAWTPWIIVPDDENNGTLIEKRFSFTCKAKTTERIQLRDSSVETRTIGSKTNIKSTQISSANCYNSNNNDGQQCWSDWGPCENINSNGYGTKIRTRGTDEEQTLACYKMDQGEWSDWSEFGSCMNLGSITSIKVRRRRCLVGQCLGAVIEAVGCGEGAEVPYTLLEGVANSTTSCASAYWAYIIPAVLSLVLIIAAVYVRARRKRRLKVPSSPHYLSATMSNAPHNTYVTLPLSDPPKRPKRQPSFTGSTTSTLIKTNNRLAKNSNTLGQANNFGQQNTMPKLYPKAIVKDMQLNGTLRNKNINKSNIHVDEDNFY